MARLPNHGIYDGLVDSGGITFMAAELWQDVQDAFQRAKDHNTLLRKARKMQEAGGGHPRSPPPRLHRSLGGSDDALRGRLPEAMRKIGAEYDVPGAAKAGRPAL